MERESKRLPQVLRYALTGGLAAAVDIGGFALLVALLDPAGGAARGEGPGQAAFPFRGLLALAKPSGLWAPAVLSFLLAAAVNYRASARWVFGSDWRDGGRALRFFLGASLGLAVNAGTTSALALLAHWPPVAAKVAGVGLAFGLNFAVNARWVFAPGPKETGPAPKPRSGARSQAR